MQCALCEQKKCREGKDCSTIKADVEYTGNNLESMKISAQIDGTSLASWGRGERVESWPDSVYCEHHGEVWG